jgi:hypothetical protein
MRAASHRLHANSADLFGDSRRKPVGLDHVNVVSN